MQREPPFVKRADAERVRKRIAETGEKALELLAEELGTKGAQLDAKGRPIFVPIDEDWVRSFKYVADQLRRDFRLDAPDELPGEAPAGPAPAAAEPTPAAPLRGLRIVKREAS